MMILLVVLSQLKLKAEKKYRSPMYLKRGQFMLTGKIKLYQQIERVKSNCDIHDSVLVSSEENGGLILVYS